MVSRRGFLSALPLPLLAQPRPAVACILNAYFPNSHADVFMSRLLDGYRLNGAWHSPRTRVAAFYVDQFPVNDMAREQAAEYGIRICKSVAEAIAGVDGIAVIGEHGMYPRTPRGNIMYPRKRYFDEIVAEFRRTGKVVPLMNDKYFAYEWTDAKAMAETVRAMKIPFFCGSSVPLSWQRPRLDVPAGAEIAEVMGVSYSDIEEHGYHAIEAMQSVAEKRRRGEAGVEAVRYLEGDEVWNLSPRLLEAALATRVNPPPPDKGQKPEAFEIRYRDGLRGTLLNLNSRTRDYLVACRVNGEVMASCFYISLYVHSHWGFMVRAFEDLVTARKETGSWERTLIANGILLAGLQSRLAGGKWIQVPDMGRLKPAAG